MARAGVDVRSQGLEPGKFIRSTRDAPYDLDISQGHRIRLRCRIAVADDLADSVQQTTSLNSGPGGSRVVLPLVPHRSTLWPSTWRRNLLRSEDIVSIGFPFPASGTTERDQVNGKTKVIWSGKVLRRNIPGEGDGSRETYLWADDNRPRRVPSGGG